MHCFKKNASPVDILNNDTFLGVLILFVAEFL